MRARPSLEPVLRGLPLVVVLAVLGSAGCCYFPGRSGGSGTAGPPPTVTPPPPPPALRPPPPTPPLRPTLDAIAAPLTLGAERRLLYGQLRVDVPTDSAPPEAAEPMDGVPGALWEHQLSLERDGVVILTRDLPCLAGGGGDLVAQAERELERRHPEVAGSISARPFPVRDASLEVVELVSAATLRETNAPVPAWFVIDVGTHVILATTRRSDLAAGRDVPDRDVAARHVVEAVLGTLRRGPWTWTARREATSLGDLFRSIVTPEGWVLRTSSCCNELPPYVSRYRETVIPLRFLGNPPRARVTARWGGCPPGTPEIPGTMLGAPMVWSRTATGLCWVERPPDGGLELGVSWHLRGATPGDLVEAMAVAATASHER